VRRKKKERAFPFPEKPCPVSQAKQSGKKSAQSPKSAQTPAPRQAKALGRTLLARRRLPAGCGVPSFLSQKQAKILNVSCHPLFFHPIKVDNDTEERGI
jgi:hypothetical protein